jgi:type II secretory pathway component PulM
MLFRMFFIPILLGMLILVLIPLLLLIPLLAQTPPAQFPLPSIRPASAWLENIGEGIAKLKIARAAAVKPAVIIFILHLPS